MNRAVDPAKTQIVAVGERAQLMPWLTPLGPITFYDAEGRPLTTANIQSPTSKSSNAQRSTD